VATPLYFFKIFLPSHRDFGCDNWSWIQPIHLVYSETMMYRGILDTPIHRPSSKTYIW